MDTRNVSNHVGGTTVHGKIYSKDRDSGHDILLLMYLLQRSGKKVFTYIKEQEMKPALVVNLTKDDISTRRA
ncbi:hypothetical protein ACS0TY_014362 [Phlomoides rotata]